MEAFQKVRRCLRELFCGLNGVGAGNNSGTSQSGSAPTHGGVGADQILPHLSPEVGGKERKNIKREKLRSV